MYNTSIVKPKALTKDLGGGPVETGSPFFVGDHVRIWIEPKKLKQLRKAIPGLTQQKLADLAGVPFQQQVSDWENLVHTPSHENMQKLAAGFAKALAERKEGR